MLGPGSHIRTIVEHLAKQQTSPATEPRAGWEEPVLRARIEVEALLEDSSSLNQRLDETLRKEQARALKLVASALKQYNETPRVPLAEISCSPDQVLGSWLPEL